MSCRRPELGFPLGQAPPGRRRSAGMVSGVGRGVGHRSPNPRYRLDQVRRGLAAAFYYEL